MTSKKQYLTPEDLEGMAVKELASGDITSGAELELAASQLRSQQEYVVQHWLDTPFSLSECVSYVLSDFENDNLVIDEAVELLIVFQRALLDPKVREQVFSNQTE